MPTDSQKNTKLLGYVVTLSPIIMEVKNGGIWKVTIIVLLEEVTFKFHDYLGGGFKYFSIFIPTWGNDPIWRIFFKGVERTN